MSVLAAPVASSRRVDRLGVLIALVAILGAILPFALFRANRIVPGEGGGIAAALPPAEAALLGLALLCFLAAAVLRVPAAVKLAAGAALLALACLLVGRSAGFLTPPGNSFARVAPGSGFWTLSFAALLLAADALVRLRLPPLGRVAVLVLALALLGLLLWSGAWDGLSLLKEYGTRTERFWAEGRRHVALAFGSVAAACLLGLPLGLLCHRVGRLRAGVLSVLNILQTVPSIALFGLLIGPLAWVAANVPGARALGISGIGAAPAFVALVGYSLLPIVSNTVVGLAGVSRSVVEAARGMGMRRSQRLFRVELPLAAPVVLTGIRIVLVQNIGIATVAALIGGGGFGVFVFQGVGQTAMDLVLLGAAPTVLLAFTAAVLLDAAVEALSGSNRRKAER
ncbi:ABC transporter permease [Antarcticirhabdus aurantiaca]|uniref:ABC transporter permease n=1 Tax=Antarcticirhabdus aurantiaca TaxID=2606717 RepID=A0ACD4NR79_9HYPH|nr:ABC transporter permease [Antarcticirhabdus aurantiaca]WAJ29281.1 ABC transporter permease [Jeongeuplla avenae]